jgi:hypothetical protein
VSAPVARLVATQRHLLFSPAWVLPFDEFRQRPKAVGIGVELDRWTGAAWVPTDVRPVVTHGGAVAYPGLGRRREPATAPPQRYRARFCAPGYRAVYAPDGEPFDATRVGREFLAHPYNDDHPPTVLAVPEILRLLPDATFEYPPGTRLVRGTVRRAGSGAPVAGALVEASGHTTPDQQQWRERAMADDSGAFRLSLRWMGRPAANPEDTSESFTLTATERPRRSGTVDIRLPEDLDRAHVIEISD